MFLHFSHQLQVFMAKAYSQSYSISIVSGKSDILRSLHSRFSSPTMFTSPWRQDCTSSSAALIFWERGSISPLASSLERICYKYGDIIGLMMMMMMRRRTMTMTMTMMVTVKLILLSNWVGSSLVSMARIMVNNGCSPLSNVGLTVECNSWINFNGWFKSIKGEIMILVL